MIDLNTLISPSLGIQLRNVATINDRGEMAAVAFFPDGNHRPVLLIPCGAQQQDSEDCQDSAGLNTMSTMQGNRTAAPTVQRNNRNAETLPAGVRGLLARRHPVDSAGTRKK